MPGAGKYTTYAPIPPASPGAKGSRNPTSLKRGFATPTEVTDQSAILKAANNNTFAANNSGNQQGDMNYMGQVNLNFKGIPNVTQGSPDLQKIGEVKVGGGGLPMTPWTPNIASPGDGNGLNPAFQTDLDALTPLQLIKTPTNPVEVMPKAAQLGVNGLLNPYSFVYKIAPLSPLTAGGSFMKLGADPGSDPPKFD